MKVQLKNADFSRMITKTVNNRDFINHTHPRYEVLYILNGKGKFVIEDIEYSFGRNSLFLIPPGKFHVMNIPPQRDYDRIVLYFDQEILPPLIEKRLCMHRITDERVRELFIKFNEYTDKYDEKVISALISGFVTETLLTIVYGDGDPGEYKNVPIIVKSAIEYIKANLDKPLTVDSIANALFISKTHLGHIFSQTMNSGIMRYVNIKRAYKARDLLKQGYSATAICEMLGYKSYPTFLRNYKTYVGKNPSEEKRDELPKN